jgi:hypothetical protein
MNVARIYFFLAKVIGMEIMIPGSFERVRVMSCID